ncbi:MAG TPA: sigma-70 family RNA polymerase sigma factor [Jatrophihabitans sp.]|nr:sigma-70 family RNA polymerase sigma factor [Jatrophihabitans sp.]
MEPPPARVPDADSELWVARLQAAGREREDAIAELHALLLPVARSETLRRAPQLRLAGPELDDIAHSAVADAVLAIAAKVATFRGESRFTTWAFKFVIFEVSAKVSRHFWRRPRALLDDDQWDRLPARLGAEPGPLAEGRQLLAAVRSAVEHELTPHQRRVFVALVVDGEPLDVLAAELGTNRNAIYKTMFDARRKVRAALAANGYLDEPTGGGR